MENIDKNLSELLIQGAGKFNCTLDENDIKKFLKYKDLLKEWNKKINLTAIEENADIIIKHFIDSLSVYPFLPNKSINLIDVGTGAGFPGIPLKIVFESVDVTLADSLEKRVKFLNEVIIELGLTGIKTVHGRAEDFGVKCEFREKFDVSVARAVANLPVLLEYCLPFVKVGGYFIAMKGSSVKEIGDSKKALDILGGKILDIKEFILPFSDIKRNIIIVEKVRKTSEKYPRKAGKPSKEPLV